MIRGDLFRVHKGSREDPKKFRIFVVVSRQVLIDSKFSTVICAPIYSRYDRISTQVNLGIEDGLKHECSVYCDELISIPKSLLTHYISSLNNEKLIELNKALKSALELK